MAAVSEPVFVKNCSPSLPSKLPCTTTAGGLSGPVDSTEMLAACAEPADKTAQASAGNRIILPFALHWLGAWQAPRAPKGRNTYPSQRRAAILWHLSARAAKALVGLVGDPENALGLRYECWRPQPKTPPTDSLRPPLSAGHIGRLCDCYRAADR